MAPIPNRMRFAALLAGAALGAAACGSGDDDGYPVRPGGGGGGGGGDDDGGADAAGPTPDADLTATGRVCVVNDLRSWLAGCDGTADEGLTITIGSSTAVTDVNGNFEIERPTTAPAMMQVAGPGIVPSNVAYDPDATILLLTAPTTLAWGDLLDVTGINVPEDAGAVFVALVAGDDEDPAVGAQVVSEPTPSGGDTLYDTADQNLWVADGFAGTFGKALLAPLTPGVVALDASLDRLIGSDSVTAVDGELVFWTLPLAE